MKEVYYLNKKEVPTIPIPHDCVIKDIKIEDNYLSFFFEDDISYHDSIKSLAKGKKSLIIKYHLVDDIYDINLYKWNKTNRITHKPGTYEEIDLIKNSGILTIITEKTLEYLCHNVGYCSIIVKLWSEGSIIFDITADHVEFEWFG